MALSWEPFSSGEFPTSHTTYPYTQAIPQKRNGRDSLMNRRYQLWKRKYQKQEGR